MHGREIFLRINTDYHFVNELTPELVVHVGDEGNILVPTSREVKSLIGMLMASVNYSSHSPWSAAKREYEINNPLSEDKWGYVYLLKGENTSWYKIG